MTWPHVGRRWVLAVIAIVAPPYVAMAQESDTGAEDFIHFCAACHGEAARGEGPMAPNLLLKPPNLRRLSALNDGTFPTARVISRIDGRDPVVAHGSMMPVYGRVFEGEDTVVVAPDGAEITTSRRIAALVGFLEGLQE
jgi:mono/diheme cytochrome c family protein